MPNLVPDPLLCDPYCSVLALPLALCLSLSLSLLLTRLGRYLPSLSLCVLLALCLSWSLSSFPLGDISHSPPPFLTVAHWAFLLLLLIVFRSAALQAFLPSPTLQSLVLQIPNPKFPRIPNRWTRFICLLRTLVRSCVIAEHVY